MIVRCSVAIAAWIWFAYNIASGDPGVQGGGWCESVESCVSRRDTYKGSSLKMEKTMGFSGILGSKQAANPGMIKHLLVLGSVIDLFRENHFFSSRILELLSSVWMV